MEIDRYHRQIVLPQVGPEGQIRLGRSSVLLVGCGALGTVIADQLVRAGIGSLRIADRDVVEITNLQRQVLFDERDAAAQVPKAVAAAERLRQVNSTTAIEPLVTDIHAGNIEAIAGLEPGGRRVDLILDGTDNAETRYLLNDVAVKHRVPWVYGACVGTEGRCMPIVPGQTPCVRCLFPQPPAPGELPTCDTSGVLAPAAAIVASLQVTAALKILIGTDASIAELLTVDLWRNRFHTVSLADAHRPDCPACGLRQFDFLDAGAAAQSTSLCGRNAVQVRPAAAHSSLDLAMIATKLRHAGSVQRTPYLVRCELFEPNELKLTIFPDGRAIVHGTADIDRARSIYARFVGS